jgi:hypothetical protein
MTNDITGAGRWIADGRMPETARAFVFDNYMIGDFNYVAIPLNAPTKPPRSCWRIFCSNLNSRLRRSCLKTDSDWATPLT